MCEELWGASGGELDSVGVESRVDGGHEGGGGFSCGGAECGREEEWADEVASGGHVAGRERQEAGVFVFGCRAGVRQCEE